MMIKSFIKAYRFRILSGLLFVVFLLSTWFVFYQKPKYPEALHISLQETAKTNYSIHSFKTTAFSTKLAVSQNVD